MKVTTPAKKRKATKAAQTLTMTIIPDEKGKRMHREARTLEEWRDHIQTADAGKKANLQFIKAALFGDVRTELHCLRHNANVEALTGIVVEHDRGTLAFDKAVAAVRKAKLTALAYTSPTYQKSERERWRMIFPLSATIDSDVDVQHTALVARANGVLGGEVADESFTLSQAYYYGSVQGNPDHRCELITGDCLDKRPELDKGRIFKDGGSNPPEKRERTASAGLDRNHYQQSVQEDPNKVRFALSKVAADYYPTWMQMAAALADEYGEDGRPIFHEWSATCPAKYNKRFADRKFNEFAKLSSYTIASVYYAADEADPGWRDEYKNRAAGNDDDSGERAVKHHQNDKAAKATTDKKKAKKADEPLKFIDIAKWGKTDPPAREWLVTDLIPMANVNLLSGEGATGKSLLAVQQGIAHALGRDWIGFKTRPGKFLYFSAEDDANEMHRRTAAILNYYKAKASDLVGKVHMLSYAGEDALLATTDRHGIVEPTELYEKFYKAAIEIKPVSIVLDTSADIFSGNEINRSEVRQFVGLIRKLAIDSGAAVSILSHPSLAGINNGSGLSGSTAWHNSVRSRAYLSQYKDKELDELDQDTSLRLLEFKKSNYSKVQDSVTLQWHHGVFQVLSKGATAFVDAGRNKAADEMFLKLLKRFTSQNRNVSEKSSARNYAPSEFAKEADAKKEGYGKQSFDAAMRRLFGAFVIEVQTYGPQSKQATRLAVRK